MGVTVSERPALDSQFNPIKIKWQSVHNPIVYEFIRTPPASDYDVISITGGGGIIEIELDGIISDLLQGDVVYVATALYNGYFTIDTITGTGLPSTILHCIGGYVGNDTTGDAWKEFNYLRENYKLEVAVYAALSAEIPVLIGTGKYSVDDNNNIKVDVSGFLQGFLPRCEDHLDYTPAFITQQDAYAACSFHIEFRETWTGSSEAFTSDIDDPGVAVWDDIHTYFAVKGVRQLYHMFGTQNIGTWLYEFVSLHYSYFPSIKFVSDFPQPVFYYGFPFDLSYINDEILYELELQVNLNGYDAAGNFVATATPQAMNLWGTPGFNRLTFIMPAISVGWPATIAYVDVSITDITTTTPIWITQRIQVRQNCYDQPIYLKWKNDNGGWDYFMFENRNETLQDSENTGLIEPAISNNYAGALVFNNGTSSDTGSNADFISKDSTNYMRVGANGLHGDYFSAMKMLCRSPKVYIYRDSLGYDTNYGTYTLPRWQTVRVRNNSISKAARHGSFNIELLFDLHKVYTMSN